MTQKNKIKMIKKKFQTPIFRNWKDKIKKKKKSALFATVKLVVFT